MKKEEFYIDVSSLSKERYHELLHKLEFEGYNKNEDENVANLIRFDKETNKIVNYIECYSGVIFTNNKFTSINGTLREISYKEFLNNNIIDLI